ncbi:MAG: SDR family oxidoreductase [Myxococcales bacterium]|nr:SDR family oxidoreductase [Myxococcales bacterium]
MAQKLPLVDPSVSLAGKLAVVTGSNTGIGKVTALELARAGARVILACRSKDKTEAAIADIKAAVPGAAVEFLALDLASLAKTRDAVATLRSGPAIDILVNNAGLGGAKGTTADGFELTFGTNHLGPFAFTHGLLDHLAPGGRVVLVSSKAHYRAKGIDFEAARKPTASKTGLPEYCESKLANVLVARELAKRLADRRIDVFALHPGVVASDIWRTLPGPLEYIAKLFMISTEEGARTSLHCATSPAVVGQTGLYWDKCKTRYPSRVAQKDDLAAELWRRSEAWLQAGG